MTLFIDIRMENLCRNLHLNPLELRVSPYMVHTGKNQGLKHGIRIYILFAITFPTPDWHNIHRLVEWVSWHVEYRWYHWFSIELHQFPQRNPNLLIYSQRPLTTLPYPFISHGCIVNISSSINILVNHISDVKHD